MTSVAQTGAESLSAMTLDKALAENRRLRDELEQARSREALFRRAVSHELRTALQAAFGFVELLEPGLRGPKLRRHLRMIRHGLDRLAWVADELYLQAELDGGSLLFQPVLVEVAQLLKEAGRAFEGRAPCHLLHMEWQPNLLSVYADPRRVHDVLGSLVAYATQLSGKGHLEMNTIALAARTAGDWVEIAVRGERPNIGPGYGDEIFGRIIEPPDSLGGQSRYGLQLGLYAAREIARRSNGDLVLQDGADQPRAFIFSLPIAR